MGWINPKGGASENCSDGQPYRLSRAEMPLYKDTEQMNEYNELEHFEYMFPYDNDRLVYTVDWPEKWWM